jgi:uncharacterized protein
MGRSAAGHRGVLLLALVLVTGAVLLNGAAYAQARAMTRYAPAGRRTPPPEALGPVERAAVLFTGVTVPRPANSRTPDDLGLGYETRTVRPGGVDGALTLEAWVVRHPQPVGTVLLFHGYAASKDTLLEAARAFTAMGYTAVLVDFRGSGGSDGDRTTVGYDEARDVAAVVRWAREELGEERPVLYGVSMGAAAVLRAVAAEGVAPRAVIVEAPFDRLLTTVRHRFEALGVPSWPASELLVFWGGRSGGFDAFGHNPVEYARRVRVPALVLHGAADPRVTEPEARAVHDALVGPRSLVVFPGLGHGVAGSEAAGEWSEAVRTFLHTLM